MSNKITKVVLNSLFGFLPCLIIGLIFFGTNIFNPKLHTFQIVLFGLVGSIYYSVYKYGKLKEFVFVAVILFIAILVFQAKAITFVTILRDLVFYFSIISSIVLYNYFLKKYYYSPRYLRAFVLALLLGVFNILATLFLIIVNATSSSEAISALWINARYGALIGVGLGLGFDLFSHLKADIYYYLKISKV